MNNITQMEQYCKEQGIFYLIEEPLKDHCTFKIGGPAALFAEPRTVEEAAGAVKRAKMLEIPLFVLGRGSNVLFADEGFSGMVLSLSRLAEIRDLGEGLIECGAGASLMQLCRYARERELEGLEFAYGIPGTVGGAVYMNAGAYGGEMKDVLAQTLHLDQEGRPGSFSGEAMDLSYRHSAYSDQSFIITGARFRLKPGIGEKIQARMDDYMNRRKSKQPLEYPSAGSTFKRPQGNYASALIDQCGLKGTCVGGAMVSEKHAGFVINRGGATCADVLGLIETIQRDVEEKTGYRLHSEVKIIRG